MPPALSCECSRTVSKLLGRPIMWVVHTVFASVKVFKEDYAVAFALEVALDDLVWQPAVELHNGVLRVEINKRALVGGGVAAKQRALKFAQRQGVLEGHVAAIGVAGDVVGVLAHERKLNHKFTWRPPRPRARARAGVPPPRQHLLTYMRTGGIVGVKRAQKAARDVVGRHRRRHFRALEPSLFAHGQNVIGLPVYGIEDEAGEALAEMSEVP
eukprot:scaffold78627_cov60-Phaeocystis_antarctica.AAC.2